MMPPYIGLLRIERHGEPIMQETQERTEAQITEIERHKYLLSEQAGYDVGWDFAEQDWLKNHASAFDAETARTTTADPNASKITMTTTTPAGLGGMLKRLFGRS